MIINGKEVKGMILPEISAKEIHEKLTPKVRKEWLDLLKEQDRRIEQWEKEHSF